MRLCRRRSPCCRLHVCHVGVPERGKKNIQEEERTKCTGKKTKNRWRLFLFLVQMRSKSKRRRRKRIDKRDKETHRADQAQQRAHTQRRGRCGQRKKRERRGRSRHVGTCHDGSFFARPQDKKEALCRQRFFVKEKKKNRKKKPEESTASDTDRCVVELLWPTPEPTRF